MATWGTMPFKIYDHDNPETVRFRKYATGAHLIAPPETGRTPGEVIWERNKARLYRYEPEKAQRHPVPVLLIYALILRPYILDLIPGNSLVEHLLGEGFDVYLLDWGIPGDEDKDMSFEHYVLDYLPEAVQSVLDSSRAWGLTLFGYCQGGTITAMHASLFPDEPLRNLVLLATPIDFAPEDPGPFGLWTLWSRNSGYLFDPDATVSGNVPADLPGRLAGAATSSFEPFASYARASLRNRLGRGEPVESFLAVSKWVDDGVPFPGEAFGRWIKDFYQQNRLARGELELRGRRVNLSNIGVPLLNITGSKDYICPLAQAEPTMDLVGSEDRELLVLDAGHVGLMAGPVAKNELWPRLSAWLGSRSR